MQSCAHTAIKPDVRWSPAEPTTRKLPYGEAVKAFCKSNHLTPREEQIVHMVCSGMPNGEMATELGISNATVRLHIGNVHRKLGTRSKVDLVVRAWAWSLTGGEAARPAVLPVYEGAFAQT